MVALVLDQLLEPADHPLSKSAGGSKSPGQTVSRGIDALVQIVKDSGGEVLGVRPPVIASFFQRLRVRMSTPEFQDEINKRFDKLERGLEVRGIAVPDSQANLQNAQGVALLTEALKNVPTAVMQLNSLIAIKVTDGNDRPTLICKTLNARQMKDLDETLAFLLTQTQLNCCDTLTPAN